MILVPLELPGPVLVDLERREDARGFFARTFSAADFEAAGLDPAVVECSVSFNAAVATLRGLHFQAEPFTEAKLVRCTSGRMWDVAVDIRIGSVTEGRWAAVELDAERRRALYVPAGFAHGFITLEPNTEVLYQCSQCHVPEAARGVRWDDLDVNIAWPLAPVVMSDRDRELPSLSTVRSTPGLSAGWPRAAGTR